MEHKDDDVLFCFWEPNPEVDSETVEREVMNMIQDTVLLTVYRGNVVVLCRILIPSLLADLSIGYQVYRWIFSTDDRLVTASEIARLGRAQDQFANEWLQQYPENQACLGWGDLAYVLEPIVIAGQEDEDVLPLVDCLVCADHQREALVDALSQQLGSIWDRAQFVEVTLAA